MPTVAPAPAADAGAPIWLGMLVLYVVWGSTYLGIAIAVDSIPPFLMAAVRFLLAGLDPADLVDRARGPRRSSCPTRREWRDSAIVGALLLGGGMGIVAFGEQTVPSGIAALLIAMMPVWVAILGGIFLGERLPRLAVVGIVVGLRRRRDPRRAVRSLGGDRRARSGRPRRAASSRRSRGRPDRCSPRTGPSCRAGRSSRPGSRCSSAGSSSPVDGASAPASSRTFDSARSRAIRSLAFALPDRHRQPARVHRLRLACCASRRCRS